MDNEGGQWTISILAGGFKCKYKDSLQDLYRALVNAVYRSDLSTLRVIEGELKIFTIDS